MFTCVATMSPTFVAYGEGGAFAYGPASCAREHVAHGRQAGRCPARRRLALVDGASPLST